MFGIFVEDKPIQSVFDEIVLPAKLVIGDFSENLQVPLSYWSIEQYYQSWLNALKQGLGNNSHSVLAVSMYNPETVNFIFSWVIYYNGSQVIVQNKMIFVEEIQNFSIHKLNDYAGKYDAYSDGEKVSEWYTTVEEIKEFIACIERKLL